jgi:hypothetical protein
VSAPLTRAAHGEAARSGRGRGAITPWASLAP